MSLGARKIRLIANQTNLDRQLMDGWINKDRLNPNPRSVDACIIRADGRNAAIIFGQPSMNRAAVYIAGLDGRMAGDILHAPPRPSIHPARPTPDQQARQERLAGRTGRQVNPVLSVKNGPMVAWTAKDCHGAWAGGENYRGHHMPVQAAHSASSFASVAWATIKHALRTGDG
jgi:hypothetical protein